MKNENKKRCSRCKEVKNIDEFTISSKSKDGKQNYCRECRIEYSRTKKIPSPHKEVKEVELKEIELLRNENKRLRDRFKILLDLYLNEAVLFNDRYDRERI